MNVRFTFTVETKLLVVSFHLYLGVDLNFISREIIPDSIHNLVEEFITQSTAAEVRGGDYPAEGDQTGLLQVDPGVGCNLAVQFVIDVDCLKVVIINIIMDPLLLDGEYLIAKLIDLE